MIVINNFGQEDTSFLDSETRKKRFLGFMAGIIQTAKDVHFNTDRPSNRNVRLRSRKHQLAERYVDGKWATEPINKVADLIINNSYDINSEPYRTDPEFQADVMNDPLSDDLMQWIQDVWSIRDSSNGCRKDSVIALRQEVRATLMGQDLPV